LKRLIAQADAIAPADGQHRLAAAAG